MVITYWALNTKDKMSWWRYELFTSVNVTIVSSAFQILQRLPFLSFSECRPGFYGPSMESPIGRCFPCPTGTYKEGIGNTEQCTPCPPGTTTRFAAQTSVNDCGKSGENADVFTVMKTLWICVRNISDLRASALDYFPCRDLYYISSTISVW